MCLWKWPLKYKIFSKIKYALLRKQFHFGGRYFSYSSCCIKMGHWVCKCAVLEGVSVVKDHKATTIQRSNPSPLVPNSILSQPILPYSVVWLQIKRCFTVRFARIERGFGRVLNLIISDVNQKMGFHSFASWRGSIGALKNKFNHVFPTRLNTQRQFCWVSTRQCTAG